jgi:hypothetical protein
MELGPALLLAGVVSSLREVKALLLFQMKQNESICEDVHVIGERTVFCFVFLVELL